MSAYLIIEAHITDPQRFAAYARATPDVVARYGGDEFEGYAVSTSVVDGDQELLDVRYQLGGTSLAEIDFAGGHGFTGLHYVSHDGSLLQFWCWA